MDWHNITHAKYKEQRTKYKEQNQQV